MQAKVRLDLDMAEVVQAPTVDRLMTLHHPFLIIEIMVGVLDLEPMDLEEGVQEAQASVTVEAEELEEECNIPTAALMAVQLTECTVLRQVPLLE